MGIPTDNEGWSPVNEIPDPGGYLIEFTICPNNGYLVTRDGYRLAYGGVPSCWQVKPEDFPVEAHG